MTRICETTSIVIFLTVKKKRNLYDLNNQISYIVYHIPFPLEGYINQGYAILIRPIKWFWIVHFKITNYWK